MESVISSVFSLRMSFFELTDDNYNYYYYSLPPQTILDFIRFLIFSILLLLLPISQFYYYDDYNQSFSSTSHTHTHIHCVRLLFGLVFVLCTTVRVKQYLSFTWIINCLLMRYDNERNFFFSNNNRGMKIC